MARPYALLRAGFPYLKTVSMRRVIDFPVDVAVTSDMRVLSLCRFEGAGGVAKIARVAWDDDANLGDIGTMGTGEGQLMWPAQMLLDRDENIVVSDEALHRITFMTTEGDFVGMWGEHGSDDGQLDRPSGIAFDADENLYVVDTMNHRVQKFTKDGKFILKWGGFGDGPGQFNMPWGIDVDELGDVYVSDWRNDRVQKFTADGRFLFETGGSGSGDGELNRPAGLCVDGDGDIYVADSENDRVVLFNPEGRYIEAFIGDATLSISGRAYLLANAKPLRLRDMANIEPQKRLRSPRSVRVDSQGRMFIPDYGSFRVQVYQKDAVPLSEEEVIEMPRSPTLQVT